MGDYDQATSDNANYYTSFVDTRRGNQDVFFEKIPVNGFSPADTAPWLVVNGSGDDNGDSRSAAVHVSNSGRPTSPGDHDAFFVALGQFVAPAPVANVAPVQANAPVPERHAEPGPAPIPLSNPNAGDVRDKAVVITSSAENQASLNSDQGFTMDEAVVPRSGVS